MMADRKTATMLSFRMYPSARDIKTGADPIRVSYRGRFVEFRHKLGAETSVSRKLWDGDRQGVEDMFRRMTQSEADSISNGEIKIPDLQPGEGT